MNTWSQTQTTSACLKEMPSQFQGIRLSVQINPPIRLSHRNKAKIIICLTIVSPPTNCWHKWQLLVNAKCHLTLLFKPRMYFYDCLNTTFWTSIVWAQFVCFLVLKGTNAVLTHWLTHNQHADSRIMCDPDT